MIILEKENYTSDRNPDSDARDSLWLADVSKAGDFVKMPLDKIEKYGNQLSNFFNQRFARADTSELLRIAHI